MNRISNKVSILCILGNLLIFLTVSGVISFKVQMKSSSSHTLVKESVLIPMSLEERGEGEFSEEFFLEGLYQTTFYLPFEPHFQLTTINIFPGKKISYFEVDIPPPYEALNS